MQLTNSDCTRVLPCGTDKYRSQLKDGDQRVEATQIDAKPSVVGSALRV
jgi:hypothetical protein